MSQDPDRATPQSNIGPPVRLHEPQRQSLWAVAFLALRTLRQIGLVQLVLAVGFVVARLPSLAAVLGLVLVVGLAMLAVASLQWWRYTFHIRDDELIVERGLVQQQRLTIPLARVQSVALEQKLLHRLVSLVQVTLDTAGTEAAEFVIDAVDEPVAVAVQRAVANHRGSLADRSLPGEPPIPPPPEAVLIQHPWKRIVQVALTQTPFAGLFLIGPLIALVDDVGRFLPVELPEIQDPGPGRWLLWFVPLLLVAGLAFSILLNLIRILLSDWNLTIRSTAAGLRRDAGLLSTTSVAATVPRVQMISVSQGILERWAGLHTIVLATIGTSKFVVPGCDADEAARLRVLVLDRSTGVTELTQRVSTSEVLLRTRNAALAAALATVVFGLWLTWWSALAFAIVPWTWFSTTRRVDQRRWDITHDAVADYQAFVGWQRQELLLRKINGVTVRQSLYERRRGLATVRLATAVGSISIGMIPVHDACEIRDQALYRVETDHRAWM